MPKFLSEGYEQRINNLRTEKSRLIEALNLEKDENARLREMIQTKIIEGIKQAMNKPVTGIFEINNYHGHTIRISHNGGARPIKPGEKPVAVFGEIRIEVERSG